MGILLTVCSMVTKIVCIVLGPERIYSAYKSSKFVCAFFLFIMGPSTFAYTSFSFFIFTVITHIDY